MTDTDCLSVKPVAPHSEAVDPFETVSSCKEDLHGAHMRLADLKVQHGSIEVEIIRTTDERRLADRERERVWEEKLRAVAAHGQAENEQQLRNDEYRRAPRERLRLCAERARQAAEECLRHSHLCISLDERHRSAEAECNRINREIQRLHRERDRLAGAVESAEAGVSALAAAYEDALVELDKFFSRD